MIVTVKAERFGDGVYLEFTKRCCDLHTASRYTVIFDDPAEAIRVAHLLQRVALTDPVEITPEAVTGQ